MACTVPPSQRDLFVRLFRAEVYRRTKFVEFVHQAEWRLATEGMVLTERVLPLQPEVVQWPPDPKQDYSLKPSAVKLLIACESDEEGAIPIGESGNFGRYEWRLAVPRAGGIAHKFTDLASFKAGKSMGVGMWATGFACLPGATIDMLGLEYSTSQHEFTYLVKALIEGDSPIVSKNQIAHHHDDVRNGRMLLELTNGCSYAVRSWKNKDSLRGGQVTVYLFNEVYQLPGLSVYTGHAQNLRVEQGFAGFTSTPDRPWVKVLHQMAHGRHPDWHCTCGSHAYQNPLAWSLSGFMDDAPDWETIATEAPTLLEICRKSGREPGRLMSKEKFLISWLGKVGGFVGRVYGFDRQGITFNPTSHPQLFKPAVVKSWAEQGAMLDAIQADYEASTQATPGA